MNWIQYKPNDQENYIPIEQWGADHWSTFAYLETCIVDGSGIIDNRKMRCNPRLHREFANIGRGELHDGSRYPTRLKDDEIENHDDWSCLEDMVAAELIEAQWRRVNREIIGGGMAKVELTAKGWAVASQLREHKGRGGKFSKFFVVDILLQNDLKGVQK